MCPPQHCLAADPSYGADIFTLSGCLLRCDATVLRPLLSFQHLPVQQFCLPRRVVKHSQLVAQYVPGLYLQVLRAQLHTTPLICHAAVMAQHYGRDALPLPEHTL